MSAPTAASADAYRWVHLAGIWIVYFCFGLVVASMAPLIPVIASDLDISNATMGAILGAWPLVYLVSAVPCGVMLDRLAPRTTLSLGCGVVGLSALLRGAAQDEISLFAAVALFGVGGPLISVGAPKLIAGWFEGGDRGFAMGVYITGPALGSATALAMTSSVMMPVFDQSWRGVMVAYATVCFAGAAVWFLIASRSNSDTQGTNGSGGRYDRQILLDILSKPAVQIVLAMGVGIFFVNHAMNNWLPEILRARGLSATQAGYWASMTTALGIVGSLVVPRHAVRGRRRPLMLLVFLAMMGSSLMLATAGCPLAISLTLLGVARTSATAIVMLVLFDISGVGPANHGLLGGMFFVAAEIGGVLGPLTVGILAPESGGFDAALHAVSAVCAMLIALVLVLPAISRRGG